MTSESTVLSPKLTKLYRRVPAEQVESFFQFRRDHPTRRASLDGHPWEYLSVGDGEKVILWLTGALARPEASWQNISYFSADHHVLAPAYPPISTMTELVDGLAGILDEERVEKADVVGGSYGGFVAQRFVRRHPQRTNKLVLSHTLGPDPERGAKIERALRWLDRLPTGWLRGLFVRRMRSLLPQTEDAAWLRAYLREVARLHLDREDLLSLFRRLVDYDTAHAFRPGDLADWPGEILLVFAEDDPVTPEAARDAMSRLYPRARVYLFRGTGHAAAILDRDRYLSVLSDFLGR